MGDEPIPESRKHPRYAVEAEVVVRSAGQTVASGRTKDVSRGGVAAVIDAVLAAGASITLSMTLVFDEDTFSEPLELPARVVWCTAIGDGHQLGTAFVGLTPDQTKYLEMFIRYLEEGQQAAAAEAAPNGSVNGDPFAS